MIGLVLGSRDTQATPYAAARAVASDRAAENDNTWRTASSPSAASLIRSVRSSAVIVPRYPWSASHASSPQCAGSSSTCDSTFQPIVKITSDGMVTPGTYEAGSGTTRVSDTDETRANRIAS